MMKKNMQALMAAVALGVGVSAVPAWAQAPGQVPVDAGLSRQQQVNQEKQQKKEQQRETKQERRELKREREQLSNMPEGARKALRAETQNAKEVDYFRAEGDQTATKIDREFGARYVAANGHLIDVRFDKTGKEVARLDLTTAQAEADARAAGRAPATAQQQPAQAPATPGQPAPTASTEAPESGNPIYRRLQANEVPQNIRAVFDKDTAGGRDVRYYRTKYGSQLAYEAKWTDAKGQEMRHYVSDAGQTLVRGEVRDDDSAQTAGASTPAANKPDDSIKTGRAELKDLPRGVRTQLSRMTEGGKDVKFYSTKYGSQQAYQAKFTSRDGKDMSVIVDESGKVLSQKADGKSSN